MGRCISKNCKYCMCLARVKKHLSIIASSEIKHGIPLQAKRDTYVMSNHLQFLSSTWVVVIPHPGLKYPSIHRVQSNKQALLLWKRHSWSLYESRVSCINIRFSRWLNACPQLLASPERWSCLECFKQQIIHAVPGAKCRAEPHSSQKNEWVPCSHHSLLLFLCLSFQK